MSDPLKDREHLLKSAVRTWGVPDQLMMAIEEMSELIKAINKARRSGLVSEDRVTRPHAEMSIKDINTYNDLCSEVADVKIMIAQLETFLCKERIDISVERKLIRLADRLERHHKAEFVKLIKESDVQSYVPENESVAPILISPLEYYKEEQSRKNAIVFEKENISPRVSKDKFVLTHYRSRHWLVAEIYKNDKLYATANKFYEVTPDYIIIYGEKGSSGSGFEKGEVKQKIFIGDSDFLKVNV